MQLLALVLLLGAAALLAVSIVSGVVTWAWGSVALSVMAAVALVVHRVQRRRARRRFEQYQRRHRDDAEVSADAATVDDEALADDEVSADTATVDDAAVDDAVNVDGDGSSDGTGKPCSADPSSGTTVDAGAVSPEPPPVGAGTPAQEDTDAADLLLVVGLDDEVVVEDEYPRYHLAGCRTLSHEIEGLPLREARELGFTPCAQCGPDATAAAAHRSRS